MQDKYGKTLMYSTARYGQVDIIKALKKAHTNVSEMRKSGSSIINWIKCHL